MTMTARFEIFSVDLDAAADFYRRVLGFDVAADRRPADDPYVALLRGTVRIGAARRGSGRPEWRRPPTGGEIVLEVDDVDAEREHVVGQGWPLDADLVDRPWGLRDFRVLDPDGYYLRITSRPGS